MGKLRANTDGIRWGNVYLSLKRCLCCYGNEHRAAKTYMTVAYTVEELELCNIHVDVKFEKVEAFHI